MDCHACQRKTPYCDRCFSAHKMWLTSPARRWGEAWARRVAQLLEWQRKPLPASWPAWEDERTQAIARRHVASLGRDDERLWEYLARECWAEAKQEWAGIVASGASREE